MKKILLILMMLALSLATLSGCFGEKDDGEDDGNAELCTTHTDTDGDHICDVCEEIVLDTETMVAVTFTVKDQDGAAVAGVKV